MLWRRIGWLNTLIRIVNKTLHHPDEPRACQMRNEHLSRLFFCPANTCCGSQLRLYYDIFETAKQIDEFEFDIATVHIV